jgi:hypothetical protein
MRLIFTFLFLLVLFVPVAAQTADCGETNTPRLLNLYLGMSPEEVQASLGRSKDVKIKIKKKGDRTFFQNFITKRPPQSLNGVRALYLRFFEGRLYQIEIFYEERNDAKTLDEFVALLSAQLNFSALSWQIEKGMARINCGGFSLVADKILNPHVEITDEAIRAKVEELRKQKK